MNTMQMLMGAAIVMLYEYKQTIEVTDSNAI